MASSERAETYSEAGPEAAVALAESGAGRRNEGQSPADTAAEIQRLRFEATVNGRYHTSRRGWYELMHRWCMFVVVIGGAAAVAEAVGQGHKHSWIVALIPTIAGTVDLVFGFSEKAAEHARLQERSFDIVAEIELGADAAEKICERGWASIARICSQESKTMRVVQALAYNDTKEGSQKNVQDDLLQVPRWARALKHISAFNGLPIHSKREKQGAVAAAS
jgi:hypothetical protein